MPVEDLFATYDRIKDKVLACPRCSCLPTLNEGPRGGGAARLHPLRARAGRLRARREARAGRLEHRRRRRADP